MASVLPGVARRPLSETPRTRVRRARLRVGQRGGRRLRSWQVASPADLLRRPREGVPAGRFGWRPSGVRREGSLVAVKTIIMKMSEMQPALQDRFTCQVVFLFYYLARFSRAGRTPTRRHLGRTARQWVSRVLGPVGAERHPDPCPPETSRPPDVQSPGKAFLDSGKLRQETEREARGPAPRSAPGPHFSPPARVLQFPTPQSHV